MPLYAGVCETNITPPLGVWMCGYAFRPSGCVAVHDELHARALVVDNGSKCIAILSIDLLGLDFDLVELARQGIARETGIPSGAIMLAATHTHGGPNVGQLNAMGSRDPAYTDVLVRKLIGVTSQARAGMRRARFAYGRESVQIGVNRRQFDLGGGPTTIGVNLAGPVQPWVDVVRIDDSTGSPFAVLFSHACHPTTLGGDNLQITADYCGYAVDEIWRKSGGRVMPIFLQGCCGNINPFPRGTFQDAARNGAILGKAAVRAMRRAEPADNNYIDHAEATIDLPLIPPPASVQCDSHIAEWTARTEEELKGGHQGRILHAEGLLRYFEMERDVAIEGRAKLSKPFTLQLLEAGGFRFLGMPAEMFVQYALDVDENAGKSPVISVAYANGVHGYVPTAADFPYGGYEVDGAHRYYHTLMYSPACELLIRKAVYDLLKVEKPDFAPYSV